MQQARAAAQRVRADTAAVATLHGARGGSAVPAGRL